MARKNKNNGVLNLGPGDITVVDSVIGDTPDDDSYSRYDDYRVNNGVINRGPGNVTISGSAIGSGASVRNR